MEARGTIRRLARLILAGETPPSSLGPELRELAELLQTHAPIKIPHEVLPDGGSRTAHGLALSPSMAARCTNEVTRTVVFARGVDQAIRALRHRDSTRPVRLLYAGCGPYALLTLCSMAGLSPDDLQVTLLDIHEPSIDSAKAVISALGFDAFIDGFVVEDACRYSTSLDRGPDIILSETMNAALEKEPQVSIVRHLAPQAPGALLLPRTVRVDAYLVDPSREVGFVESSGDTTRGGASARVFLGPVFELNAESIRAWPRDARLALPAGSLRIPERNRGLSTLALYTTVVVYSDHRLRCGDSTLTYPKPVPTDGALRSGDVLRFRYRVGPQPGLIWDVARQHSPSVVKRRQDPDGETARQGAKNSTTERMPR